ncbi:hypothetical protein TrST_g11370 [Triparma strigata]|uniref:Uncharacterized protein n=1 Tax=Triparma strigata TaxID=1606541 RepID=A0A9W7EFB5_9STRA|nr:hypothetical protein TrST_g11370 [Triparma strigata]
MVDVTKKSEEDLVTLLDSYIDVGLNAIVQTEILRRSNLHLRDSLASLESSNQSLTVSLKASTDDATKLAEEMAEVSGRRGEEWRERKEEIERKRETEEEVARLRAVENAHVLLLGDREKLAEEIRRLKMKVQLVTQQHLSEKRETSKEVMEEINASSQAQLLKRKIVSLKAKNESLEEKLRESDRANVAALQNMSNDSNNGKKKKSKKAYGR